MAKCSIDECNAKSKARGLCSSHYGKQYYITNIDKIRVDNKLYRTSHPGVNKESDKRSKRNGGRFGDARRQAIM